MKTYKKRLTHVEKVKSLGSPQLYDTRLKKREEYFRLFQLRADLIQDIKASVSHILSSNTLPISSYKYGIHEYVYYIETCGESIEMNNLCRHLDQQDASFIRAVSSVS